jgi:hypothetical protein
MKSEELLDYVALAESLDALREMLRAMVAALMDDGFTEKQARAIATGVFVGKLEEDNDEDGE